MLRLFFLALVASAWLSASLAADRTSGSFIDPDALLVTVARDFVDLHDPETCFSSTSKAAAHLKDRFGITLGDGVRLDQFQSSGESKTLPSDLCEAGELWWIFNGTTENEGLLTISFEPAVRSFYLIGMPMIPVHQANLPFRMKVEAYGTSGNLLESNEKLFISQPSGLSPTGFAFVRSPIVQHITDEDIAYIVVRPGSSNGQAGARRMAFSRIGLTRHRLD
ncbi:MAG: hypothetical protein HRU11_12490 [Parvularculaceae bacterium]|nr:hypothetical protein [Parvularculaceae bacterium]